MQKIVIPRETGGMTLELGAAIGCKEKHSQVGGEEFDSMSTRITRGGRKKNYQILYLLSFSEEKDFRKFVLCEVHLFKYFL